MLRDMTALQVATINRTLAASSWRFAVPAAAPVGDVSVSPMDKRSHIRHTGNVWPLRPQEVSSG